MSRIGIFCIFLAFSAQVKAASHGRICVSDYWYTISCSLKLPIASSRNISYWLEAHSIISNQNYSCQPQRVHEDHVCNFTTENIFKSFDKYSMTLYYSENGTTNSSLLDGSFKPVKNIKTKTPFNLTLQYANGTYRFFWKSGYENHDYREALPIIYEFKYHKDGDTTSVNVHPSNEVVQLDETKLDPNTVYTVMVRSTVDKINGYSGTWSDWSSSVKWKTAHKDEPSQLGKIGIGILVLVILLILLMSIPAARFKMKEISWVPTPATYFQPLYQNYQGNFQCWVLAKSPLQDFQVMEDFSKIDKISEVLTTLQDQVEKTGMYLSGESHTPYVGPTAEVWAPCQLPDTLSETSIPCEEFSLFCEELPDKVDNLFQSLNLTCLNGDVLSLKDSALSLECLEDHEASEAPVIINPVPTCFKQDYCTLTNTPTGPVPTFTRDVQQDDKTSKD
ncbi:interleukin 21 receptor, tandem duplicate 2 isoform X2 [Puntigrus tetrazona]|uniref:interleukin 21 receptor, tandem duplicate 2 isoform X2 n=1 Tax=Puntigrus tetrazona TaxID=1606681 RepID=UPI001C89521A|nr:interleukin 21 receptor, tandem duplicate 2 isoform X2 [Puntigrus tetrazona]